MLQFSPKPEGLYVCIETHQRIFVSEWTSHADSSSYAGTFLRLRDDGLAVEQDDGRALLLYWSSVANLTVNELRCIHLPDSCPYTLEIVTDGSLRDADLELHYGFIRKGRRIPGLDRTGAWLRSGNDHFILINPLYDIIEAIDQFNDADGQDLEGRMLQWGRISEKLPDDTVIPNHLRSIKITVATGFKLNPFLNESGEPDFDPVLGQWKITLTEGGEEKRKFESNLPRARQSDFAKKFRGLDQVKHRYAIGGSSFIVLSREIEQALVTVRRAQKASLEERCDFLGNVSGHLRGALDDAGEMGVDVDKIFCDDDLSERVIGVGIWVKQILPWIRRASEPWLPPEQLGLRIDSIIVHLEVKELPSLLTQVKAAIKSETKTVVTTDGTEIPAHLTTVSAIEELIRRAAPVQPPISNVKANNEQFKRKKGDKSDQVLLVIDNLESLQFRRERRRSVAGISQIKPCLRSTLLSHQEEAVEWLLRHWEIGSWGSLLADDMGLGKTLEALAFLSCLQTHIRNQGIRDQPILVVAPAGLLRNWRDEHAKHLSGIGLGRAVEAHGAGLKHLKIDKSPPGNELGSNMALPKLNIDKLKRAAWVLTTYETLRDYQHSFGRVHWCAGIFDEAQKIKNPSAQITVAALAMNIDFSLLMTGTPVENRAADIWSLLERVEPGMFGTLKEFSRKHESKDSNSYSTLEELNHVLTSDDGTPQLMLRRLKKDYLPGLPEKNVHTRIVNMPQCQADAYEEVVNHSRVGGSGMLQTLHRLRSISLHPETSGNLSNDQYIQQSARLSETFIILREIAEIGQKTLIFVESREMQGFLIGALRRYFQLPEDVLVINGTVPGKIRKARVDIFQKRRGFDIMLLSPRAGGVGLTLTAANHVIHLSRWWNPAVEDQCTDRVFRIGQNNSIHVYFPMARHPRFGNHSFDLKLDELITRKRDMNQRILSPTTANNEDVQELYRSTILGTEDVTDVDNKHVNLDFLDPVDFENWVLRQLAQTCYEIHRTPLSGDRGADGLAYFRKSGREYTILVQCKRLQPDSKCGRTAVEEVLRAVSEYEIRGEARPLVVTTAHDFTQGAKRLASCKHVELLSRANLHRLRTWKP